MLGAHGRRDMALMVRQFDLDGFGMSEEQYAEQVGFLGREPRRYEDFVRSHERETAAKWKAEARKAEA